MVSGDSRRLQRRVTLVRVGEQVAEALSGSLVEEFGINEPVTFHKRHRLLDAIVAAYFSAVTAFKAQHGFAPDEKINQTKIAALMVETILSFDDLKSLFEFPESAVGSAVEAYSAAAFAYRAMCTFLFVEVERVPEDLELDIKFNLLRHEPIHHDWLCSFAATLYEAFGDKSQVSSD